MKRKLMFKSILSIAFLSNAFVSYAYDYSEANRYYNYVEGGYELTCYGGYDPNNRYKYSGNFVIPETVNGRKVVGIGSNAFKDCTALFTVSIPNTVTYIRRGAFDNCILLENIVIPE